MKSIAVKLSTLLFVIVTVSAFTMAQDGTAHHIPVNMNIDKFDVQRMTLGQTLRKLSQQFKIPIGFQSTYDKDCENSTPTIEFSARNESLATVLDRIMPKQSCYTWSINNGIVYVVPKAEGGSLLSKLLNTDISEFNLAGSFSYLNLRSAITNLESVQSFLRKNEIKPDHAEFFVINARNKADLNLSLRNVKLAYVLDEIVKQSGRKMWIVGLGGEDDTELLLDFY